MPKYQVTFTDCEIAICHPIEVEEDLDALDAAKDIILVQAAIGTEFDVWLGPGEYEEVE